MFEHGLAWLLAGTLAYAFCSALIPVVPIEPILVAVAARGSSSPEVIAVAVAAATGQMAGKLLVFMAGAGRLTPAWLSKKSKASGRGRRWLDRGIEWARRRPYGPASLCLFSSFSGLPPFAATAFGLGALRQHTVAFLTLGWVGRFARLVLVALAPGLITWPW